MLFRKGVNGQPSRPVLRQEYSEGHGSLVSGRSRPCAGPIALLPR